MATTTQTLNGTAYVVEQNTAGALTPHSQPEVAGLPVNAQNPMPTTFAGSLGHDWSVNPLAIPLSGYVLKQTVPVNATRQEIAVQNLSTDVVQIVTDDGTGANQTSWLLAAATAASQPGEAWRSAYHRGRVMIYVPSVNSLTDTVSISEH